MNKGLMIVISGFSGAGKGTLIKRLLDKYPDYVLSVSATTREPREGEIDGVDYFFKTKKEFEDMIDSEQFIEYERYVGNYYGTPKKYVKEMMASGRDVILEIDVRGGLTIKKRNPDAVLVFVSAPSIKEIERRLRTRGAKLGEDVDERLRQFEREMESVPMYDYILINDDIEDCVENLNAIAVAERQRISNNKPYTDRIRNEINGGR